MLKLLLLVVVVKLHPFSIGRDKSLADRDWPIVHFSSWQPTDFASKRLVDARRQLEGHGTIMNHRSIGFIIIYFVFLYSFFLTFCFFVAVFCF